MCNFIIIATNGTFPTTGRTGRAGRRGEAITLFTEADLPRIRSIANVVKLSGCPVPDWMLAIKQVRALGVQYVDFTAVG